MTERHIIQLQQRLGADMVLTGDAIAPYCRDWHGDVQSGAVAVLRPKTVVDVQAAVKAARDLGLGVVPQGGNTGLVLGAISDAPDRNVVLSLSRLNRIRQINRDDFSAVVEAGVVLEALKTALEPEGLFFPLALGAQGSCQIGGNVSTNAGGVNVLRYGMTRDLVLGLEVVLPDGSLFEGLSLLRKDNRGIDLKQLFIGAEGTLGVITAVSLKLVPKPAQVATALVALPSLDAVMALYTRARQQCCDLMSAFEFMPPLAFALAREAMPDLPRALREDHPAYALIEISGGGLVDVDALLAAFVEHAMEAGLILDGVVAQTLRHARDLWRVREGMNDGQAKRGPHFRSDVSVPLSRLAAFVAEAEARIGAALPDATCISYGHVGDGNVHLNVLPPSGADQAQVRHVLETAKYHLFDLVARYQGSISAEHGIGRAKRSAFKAGLPDVQRKLLERLKLAIDPHLTMNPGCQMDMVTHSSDPCREKAP